MHSGILSSVISVPCAPCISPRSFASIPGISVDKAGRVNVVHITRDESAWRSRLIRVAAADWAFFRGQDVEPEICYEVEPILYQWERGHIYDPQTARGAR